MIWLALGAALVALVLRDIFHTLFHPAGSGSLSSLVQRGVWRGFRLASDRHGWLALAGPTAVVSTIGVWFFLGVTGWALLYWPYLPEEFRFSSPLEPNGSFQDAFYLAITTQSTLGFGDITPTNGWLQVVTALEAVAGFALLTASLSWIVSIYPALGRRRALAGRTSVLLRAVATGAPLPPATLERLAAEVVRVRADLVQSPILYRFHTAERELALPALAGALHELATAQADGEERAGALALAGALDGLCATLERQFLGRPGRTTAETLAAFAADHAYG